MRRGEIDFPPAIIQAIQDQRLVLFAGAGVSMGPPAFLKNFETLAKALAEESGIPKDDYEPPDRYLGRLEGSYPNMRKSVCKILDAQQHNRLHEQLLLLFRDPGSVRVVTTNFESLFEKAASAINTPIPTFTAPALPLGNDFQGIVHVHGVLQSPNGMILTDADFGRAYLTEGWARRFLLKLFETYTVVFVGYSHDDTVMTYLSRALPPQSFNSRFALVGSLEKNIARWELLGISVVQFPQVNDQDFSALGDGIEKLANLMGRGALDHAEEIKRIATRPLPLPPEDNDFLKFILIEPWAAELYLKHAAHSVAIAWLDREGFLVPLFSSKRLNDQERVLARFVGSDYATGHSESCQLLCARHGFYLNTELWHTIARHLSFESPPSPEVFVSWIGVLLAAKTDYKETTLFVSLARRAVELERSRCVMDLFSALVEPILDMSEWIDFDISESAYPPQRIVTVAVCAGNWELSELWLLMKPELSQFAEPMARMLLTSFERRHRMYSSFGDADSSWSPDGRHRSAIEPHEQDQHPDAVGVMIDILRDCLVHLSGTRPEFFPLLLSQLTECDMPLQRRLAVHIVNTTAHLTCNDKLAWIIDTVALDDLAAHHEIYSLLSTAFPSANSETKERIVGKVMELESTTNESEDREDRTDRLRYDLLGWLRSVDCDCELVNTRFDEIQSAHPDWLMSEHADFTRYFTGGWVSHASPLSKEELLARDPKDWLGELLEFQGDEFAHTQVSSDSIRVVDRAGLREELATAARINQDWGIKLAHALHETDNWRTDLWKGLFKGWEEWKGCKQTVDSIFAVLLIPECHSSHTREVSRLLKSYVEALWQSENEVLPESLVRANELARLVWKCLPRTAPVQDQGRDWSLYAINHPSGFLVQYWVRAHNYSIRNNKDLCVDTTSFYEEIFNTILYDKTEIGGAGRNILCHYVAYFLSALPDWTTSNLLPLFSSEDELSLRQAWQGLLTSGKLGPKLWTALKSDILNMVKRLNVLDDSNQSNGSPFKYIEQFEKLYAACICFYVDDPLKEWIPTFYRHTDSDAHARFAMWIGGLLHDVDAKRRKTWWESWMRSHWNNRNQGNPCELKPTEAGNMLNWIENLDGVFQDAVTVAVQTPKSNMKHSSLFYRLNKSDLPERFPNAMASLLVHVLKDYSGDDHWHYNGAGDIAKKILPKIESDDIRQRLRETMLRCRFSTEE